MAQSEHHHDPAGRQPRGRGKYCAYCGAKRHDDPPATTARRVGAKLLAQTFCDGECERAWDIDAPRDDPDQ